MSVFAGRRARCGLAIAVAVLAGAAPPSAAAADQQGCNPLALETCLAPFPSNYWAVEDPSSPTGLRGEVTDDLLRPELLRQLPTGEGISPSGIFNGATGFSAGAGAVFEFTQRQAPPPPDGGDAVLAFDADTGERIPVDAFLSAHARNPILVGAKQSNVLQVFARSRWPYRHRVLVAVTTKMGAGDPAFPELAAKAEPGTRAAAYVAEVRDAIEDAGLDPADVRTATLFTVRDRDEVVGATQRLLDDTAARPHPARNVRMNWSYAGPYTAGIVTGQLRVDNYRTRDGRGPVDFSGRTRKDQWVPFQLTLPRSAASRPAPVVIYAHGITVQKESDIAVSQMNAKLGLATISIDWPNHGARSREDGGYLLDLLSPRDLGTLAGLFNQATVDQMGLYEAIGDLQLAQQAESGKAIAAFGQFGETVGGVEHPHLEHHWTGHALVDRVDRDFRVEEQTSRKKLGLHGAFGFAVQRMAGIKPDLAVLVIGQVQPFLRHGRGGGIGGCGQGLSPRCRSRM